MKNLIFGLTLAVMMGCGGLKRIQEGEPVVTTISINDDDVTVFCRWSFHDFRYFASAPTTEEAKDKCFKRLREVVQPAEKSTPTGEVAKPALISSDPQFESLGTVIQTSKGSSSANIASVNGEIWVNGKRLKKKPGSVVTSGDCSIATTGDGNSVSVSCGDAAQ